jgi:hypothetical protein
MRWLIKRWGLRTDEPQKPYAFYGDSEEEEEEQQQQDDETHLMFLRDVPYPDWLTKPEPGIISICVILKVSTKKLF